MKRDCITYTTFIWDFFGSVKTQQANNKSAMSVKDELADDTKQFYSVSEY